MFLSILKTQWAWSRLVVALGVVLAFLLPLQTVQQAGLLGAREWEITALLDTVESWSVWYAALAAGVGLLVATSCWAPDHRGRHVYALSLPIPRWHYVLLRFAAGAVLLVAPVAALWIGAVLATATAHIPESLRAYPHVLMLRFALATFVAYGLFFAISSGTTRTAAYILLAIGGLFAVQLLLSASGSQSQLAASLWDRLVSWPGPLQVFTGRWMLIDV